MPVTGDLSVDKYDFNTPLALRNFSEKKLQSYKNSTPCDLVSLFAIFVYYLL